MKEIKYTILYCVFVETFVIPFYYGSETVINYGSGSDFLTSYGFGSGSTTLGETYFDHVDKLDTRDLHPPAAGVEAVPVKGDQE
jgi:hypothetical protein